MVNFTNKTDTDRLTQKVLILTLEHFLVAVCNMC